MPAGKRLRAANDHSAALIAINVNGAASIVDCPVVDPTRGLRPHPGAGGCPATTASQSILDRLAGHEFSADADCEVGSVVDPFVAVCMGNFLTLLKDPPPEVAERHRQQVAERSASRLRGADLRPAADQYGGPEARRWLSRNRNPSPLASNHFAGPGAALGFAEELYALGATRVIVPESCIIPEDDDGPCADALVVFLPPDPERRAAVCRRCEQELDEPQRIEPSDPNPIFLWWD